MFCIQKDSNINYEDWLRNNETWNAFEFGDNKTYQLGYKCISWFEEVIVNNFTSIHQIETEWKLYVSCMWLLGNNTLLTLHKTIH